MNALEVLKNIFTRVAKPWRAATGDEGFEIVRRRLYEDWSTLDKFQCTRGVLRLLAKVIHRLWELGDAGLLIMPASIPMDDHAVKSELTRYLDNNWEPIISKDVDGPNSLPLSIDQKGKWGRGRNSRYREPPAQIPASGTTALGSCLGF